MVLYISRSPHNLFRAQIAYACHSLSGGCGILHGLGSALVLITDCIIFIGFYLCLTAAKQTDEHQKRNQYFYFFHNKTSQDYFLSREEKY